MKIEPESILTKDYMLYNLPSINHHYTELLSHITFSTFWGRGMVICVWGRAAPLIYKTKVFFCKNEAFHARRDLKSTGFW